MSVTLLGWTASNSMASIIFSFNEISIQKYQQTADSCPRLPPQYQVVNNFFKYLEIATVNVS